MLDDLRPYPEYRDSGVPWLGRIPAHWEVRRNGRLFRQRNETGFAELPILEVSLRTGVRVRPKDGTGRKQMMSDRAKYKRAARGDVAYNIMRMWQGAVGVAPVDGLVSPAYVVAEPFPEVEARYFSYLFRTDAYMGEVDGFSRGIVKDRNRLYWEDFKRIPSLFPPPEEQRRIGRFLDAHGQKVAAFIRNRRRLIELLNEQKQAIIRQAITGRTDVNGPRPEEDVPQHWSILPLKRVLRSLIDCEHKTAPAVDDGPYRVVRTTAIRQGRLNLAGTYCTTEEGYREWTRRGVPSPGDVMFTREAPAGEACLVPPDLNLCLGQRTVLFVSARLRMIGGVVSERGFR